MNHSHRKNLELPAKVKGKLYPRRSLTLPGNAFTAVPKMIRIFSGASRPTSYRVFPSFFCLLSSVFCYTFFATTAVSLLGTAHTIAAQPAAMLQEWSFDPNTLQLLITLNQSTTPPRYFLLSQPSRLVVDLPDTQLGKVPTQQNFSGAVTQVRVSQFQAGVTRIVMDLAPNVVIDPVQVQLQPISVRNPVRWVLRPAIATGNTTQVPTTNNFSPPSATPPTTLPTTLPPAIFNNQQPLVTVPPLNSNNNNSFPTPRNNRPTANFPQPSILNRPPVARPEDVTVPTTTKPQPSTTEVQVIEFGQPLPE